MKRILLIVFVAFGLAGIAAAIQQVATETAAKGTTNRATSQAAAPDPLPDGDLVVVTYFSSDYRCASCVRLETLPRAAVEANFAREMSDGRVAFRVVNLNGPGNMSYAQRYSLVSKTVIVSEVVQGQERDWENLQQVWTKMREPAEFEAYVVESVRRHLGGAT